MYLIRTGTLSKYRYLENGAHWAIMALGIMMIAKLFHVELPEWATGGLGLIFISLAIASSILEMRSINLQESMSNKFHSTERQLKRGVTESSHKNPLTSSGRLDIMMRLRRYWHFIAIAVSRYHFI